jgi:DNA polymerase-4
MQREILYLKVPSFPVALERTRDPSLRGRPVAICSSGSGRSLLQAVSLEARKEGLFKGMPRRQALERCPGLRLLQPDPAHYQKAANELFRILSAYSPLVEPARPGSLFLDLTGTYRLFGPARDLAWKIRNETRKRLGMDPNLGMATNKLLSRIAARVLPASGLCDIFPGGEGHFIGPLEVGVLPAARPFAHAERLRELNIQRVKELLPIPISALQVAFGSASIAFYRQARGVDASPVRPPMQTPRITEEETLPEESNEDALLLAALQGLAEAAGRRLRGMEALAGRMELEVQYADAVLERRSARLEPRTDLDVCLFLAASRLFERAAQRRVRIRRIALHLLQIDPLPRQLSLFSEESSFFREATGNATSALPDSHKGLSLPGQERALRNLQQALDEIRSRFGKEAIRRGGVSSQVSGVRCREERRSCQGRGLALLDWDGKNGYDPSGSC